MAISFGEIISRVALMLSAICFGMGIFLNLKMLFKFVDEEDEYENYWWIPFFIDYWLRYPEDRKKYAIIFLLTILGCVFWSLGWIGISKY